LVHFTAIFLWPCWYTFSHFGLLHQEKFDNPGWHLSCRYDLWLNTYL
jgi:hypothetical protein